MTARSHLFRDVPCGGCMRCCRGDAIRLLPMDNPARYLTVPHPRYSGQLMLDHKPNGDCVYLGEQGCTIQDDKPLMCQEMDCRHIAKALSFTQARKMNVVHIWRRGRELTTGNTTNR